MLKYGIYTKIKNKKSVTVWVNEICMEIRMVFMLRLTTGLYDPKLADSLQDFPWRRCRA